MKRFGFPSRRLDGVAWLPLTADATTWVPGLAVAMLLVAPVRMADLAADLTTVVAGAAACQGVFGLAFGVYRGRATRASFDEMLLLAGSVAATVTVLVVADATVPRAGLPLSCPPVAGGTALLIMMAVRLAWRWRAERALMSPDRQGKRTIVFGAGEGGYEAIRAMLRRKDSPYRPVALLDDDPGKRRLRLMGVPVVGTRREIERTARRLEAEVLLVAIPSASGALLRELTEPCRRAGLVMKVLPPVHELIGGRARLGDIRDIQIADVLGRPPALMDPAPMAEYLRGRRVMVTGAGGSIGAELCRVLARYEPGELLMLDRDESALHAVQLSLTGRALLDSGELILADIRDNQQLIRVFDERRPDVVFHAAALKHLPLLERYPGEAIKTNVWGTLAVLAAAVSVGAERFVNISTDKAADPVSVLGLSKRITERLTAHGMGGRTTCLSVRFGNVLGSRGSVLHTFLAQVKAGGPITVTDPDVTRYLMTVTEAVHLVIAAGGVGKTGEVLVLDMGEPVRIDEVARRVSQAAPVPIVYTGLRPGEKLNEQLFGTGEVDRRPIHPLISHVSAPPLSPVDAYALDPWAAPDAVVADLRRLAFAPLWGPAALEAVDHGVTVLPAARRAHARAPARPSDRRARGE